MKKGKDRGKGVNRTRKRTKFHSRVRKSHGSRSSCQRAGRCGEITEENFLKEESALAARFEAQSEAFSGQFAAAQSQKERDSLTVAYNALFQQYLHAMEALSVQYAATPSGLQRCFAMRLGLSKDTLRIVWKRLPKELRGSLYGRAMALHGRAKELRPGGKMYNLRAWDAQGRPFRLRQWRGTPVLLLYGGLGCMGTSGREYLDALCAKTSREELRIVVFWPVSSPDELAALAEEYPSGYLQVSDFKGDTSPVKIRCQAQATPTCFLLDSRGRLVFGEVVGAAQRGCPSKSYRAVER